MVDSKYIICCDKLYQKEKPSKIIKAPLILLTAGRNEGPNTPACLRDLGVSQTTH